MELWTLCGTSFPAAQALPHPPPRNLTGLFLPPVCSAHTCSLSVFKAAFHLCPGSGPGPVCCPITSLSSVYSPEGFLPRGLYMFPVLHIFVTILLMTFLFHLRVPRPKGWKAWCFLNHSNDSGKTIMHFCSFPYISYISLENIRDIYF